MEICKASMQELKSQNKHPMVSLKKHFSQTCPSFDNLPPWLLPLSLGLSACGTDSLIVEGSQ